MKWVKFGVSRHFSRALDFPHYGDPSVEIGQIWGFWALSGERVGVNVEGRAEAYFRRFASSSVWSLICVVTCCGFLPQGRDKMVKSVFLLFWFLYLNNIYGYYICWFNPYTGIVSKFLAHIIIFSWISLMQGHFSLALLFCPHFPFPHKWR